jgi:hypothetical protein
LPPHSSPLQATEFNPEPKKARSKSRFHPGNAVNLQAIYFDFRPFGWRKASVLQIGGRPHYGTAVVRTNSDIFTVAVGAEPLRLKEAAARETVNRLVIASRSQRWDISACYR